MTPVALIVLDLGASAAQDLAVVNPATTVLPATDLAATRGDGIFETVVTVSGVPQASEAHLDRFARSARMLDLPEPDRALWRRAVTTAAAYLREHPRGAVKYVMSRGDEAGTGVPTGWALAFVPAARAEIPAPLDVVTLDRGYRSDVAQTSPWLLQGAKTLSYAVNMAAMREARRRDAQDVIFLSIDGFVLEGPNSTVIARFGDRFVTPPVELGILPGTTQHDAFAALHRDGRQTQVRPLTAAELTEASALWLCSSTRGAAPIAHLDGRTVPVDADATAIMNHALDDRKE